MTYMLVAAGFNDQTIPYGEQNGLVKEQQVVVGIIICKFLSVLFYFTTKIWLIVEFHFKNQLPLTTSDWKMIWIIWRGIENLSTNFHDFQLPSNARFILDKIENETYDPLSWVLLVNISNGHGPIFSHTLAVRSRNLNFLEGYYHAYTKYD